MITKALKYETTKKESFTRKTKEIPGLAAHPHRLTQTVRIASKLDLKGF